MILRESLLRRRCVRLVERVLPRVGLFAGLGGGCWMVVNLPVACNVYDADLVGASAGTSGWAGMGGAESLGGKAPRGGRSNQGGRPQGGTAGAAVGNGGTSAEAGQAGDGGMGDAGGHQGGAAGEAGSGGSDLEGGKGGVAGESSGHGGRSVPAGGGSDGGTESGGAGGDGGAGEGGAVGGGGVAGTGGEGGLGGGALGGTAGVGGGAAGGSGNGGDSGSGGSGSGGVSSGGVGSGGVAGTADNCGVAGVSVVDDMEDGDGGIRPCAGRKGYWYSLGPASAEIEPPPGTSFMMTETSEPASPVEGSLSAARVLAGDLSELGGMGLSLYESVGGKRAYDASSYAVVRFTYRTVGLDGGDELRFRILTMPTTPTDEAGACTAGSDCNNHYGRILDPVESWTRVEIPLVAGGLGLTQEPGWGLQVSWHPDLVLDLQFIARTVSAKDVELWVDQIEFVE